MKSKYETYFGVRVPKFRTFAVELFRCKGPKHQRHDQFRESTASYDFLQKYTLSMDKLQYLRPSAAGLYYYPPGRACKPNSSGDYEKRDKLDRKSAPTRNRTRGLTHSKQTRWPLHYRDRRWKVVSTACINVLNGYNVINSLSRDRIRTVVWDNEN